MNYLPLLFSLRNTFLLVLILTVGVGGSLWHMSYRVEITQSADRRAVVEQQISQVNRRLSELETRIAQAQRPDVLRMRIGERLSAPREENVVWVTEMPGSRPELTQRRLLAQTNPSSAPVARTP